MTSGDHVLDGLFLELGRRGFPIGARDYLDVLRALEGGYGLEDRDCLKRLCKNLWARGEDEERAIDQLFSELQLPEFEEPDDDGTKADDIGPDDPDSPRTSGQSSAAAEWNKEDDAPLEFVPTNQPGIDVPRARVRPDASESFFLSERPLIAQRALTVIWRRYRVSAPGDDCDEIDLQACIREKCRRGFLERPVFRAGSRNVARLLVLIDVSPSMAAWRPFNAVVERSLPLAKLASYQTLYFENVPKKKLYLDEQGTESIAIEELLAEPMGLLVVSDAGAARGALNKRRVARTREFLERVRDTWDPVAWANPMPVERWQGTTAERLAAFTNLSMVELSQDGLTRAVDIIRGQRDAS